MRGISIFAIVFGLACIGLFAAAALGGLPLIVLFGLAFAFLIPGIKGVAIGAKGLEPEVRDAVKAEYSKRYKTCPFCTERIKKSARKCKHCGSMLESDITLACPRCGQNLLIASDLTEETVVCPACKSELLVSEDAT